MRALIVVDQSLSPDRLSKLIAQFNPESKISQVSDHGEGAVNFLQSDEHPDLVFLDIPLAAGSTLESFKQINHLNAPINHHQTLEQAIDTLRKRQDSVANIMVADFAKILLEQQKTYKERFLVKLGRKLFYKNVSDIAYFFAEGKIVYLVEKNTNRKFIVDHTLDELADRNLDPAKFFRINRTFILSIDSIQEIQPYTNQRLLVDLNQEQPHDLIVSREKCTSFKAWLNY